MLSVKPGVAMIGRSPYGERGLKYLPVATAGCKWRRSPYGERGLKSRGRSSQATNHMSLSLRRAWIEMP